MAGGRTRERVATRATKSTQPADADAQQTTLRERQQSKALQEKIAKIEKREAWTRQYQLGKDHTEFEGMGCGTCSLIGPYVEFTSPFCGTGRLEVSEGSKGLESGSIRICRGPDKGDGLEYMKKPKRNKIPDHQLDIFMFPSKNIESITLTPSAPEDSTVGVVITSFAPAGDTDVHKTPQPVTLQWPKTTVEGRFKQYAEDENETAVSILVRVMNRLLSPFGKEVNTELLESF